MKTYIVFFSEGCGPEGCSTYACEVIVANSKQLAIKHGAELLSAEGIDSVEAIEVAVRYAPLK